MSNQTTSGGPAGSVIEAAVAKVGSARASEVGRAADLLEEAWFRDLGDGLLAFERLFGHLVLFGAVWHCFGAPSLGFWPSSVVWSLYGLAVVVEVLGLGAADRIAGRRCATAHAA